MARKDKQRMQEPASEHLEELKTSIAKYNDSFTTLLNLVPAKYYLTQEDDDVAQPASTANLTRKQKRKLAQDAKKDKMDVASAKRLAKKAKYDPSTPRTVTEIQNAREEQRKANQGGGDDDAIFLKGFDFDTSAAQGTANIRKDESEDEDSANDSDFSGSDDDGASASAPAQPKASASTSQRPSITELRARLQPQGQGRAEDASTNGDGSMLDADSSSAGKEALLAERKRRAEIREKRRKLTKERIRKEKDEGVPRTDKGKEKESGSALPLANAKPSKMSDIKKALKKEGKRQFFNLDTEGDGQGGATASRSTSAAAPLSQASTTASNSKSTSNAVATAPSIPANVSGSIAFSSLDFAPSSAVRDIDTPKMSKKQREQLGKDSRMGLTSHDPSVALSALNKREEFLSKLTPAARERAEEKDKWERMAMRAEGTKVYDDEAKLKKMMKRKEKAKDKSRKDWADRKETAQNAQAKAQKKREENINARLQQKKDKKMGVKPGKSVGKGNSKKKGRPGFEGKGGGKRK